MQERSKQMAKTITGTVVSTGMQNTIVIEVTRRVPHPLYKKLLKQTSRFKADTAGKTVKNGDTVVIVETKPISKDKHFALQTVIENKEEKK